MKTPDVILVPTDFGPPSAAALEYAVELAKRFAAREVVLLHTYQIPIVSFPDGAIVATAEMTSGIVDAATKELDTLTATVANADVPVRPLLREGDPADTIEKAAEQLGADLIVMGTRGRHGLARVLLGSVTERVVRTSKIPVLTVHGNLEASPHSTTPKNDANAPSAPSSRAH